MTQDNILLAMLDSKEAEANAKAEFIAEWVGNNRPLLLAGMLDTDAATLLAEVDADQARQLNQVIWLLMTDGDQAPLMQLVEHLMTDALTTLAETAWGYHAADLEHAMSEEQWEQYQFNHQRTAA